MMRLQKNTFIFSLVFLLTAITASASDLAKEKRWAEQVEDGLLEGESLMLSEGQHSFLAVFTEAVVDEKNIAHKDTAIILLHGLGVHPDWPQVINPLRVALPEQGWSVLSLQLPVLENGAPARDYLALYKEVPARLVAGIKFLKDKGAKKIVIVAHSLGTEMAGYSLTHAASKLEKIDGVSAFVGIGMGSDTMQYLSKMDMPVFDLYGEEDLQGVVTSAKQRAKAAKGNKDYQQIRVKGADHFFDGYEKELIQVVGEWVLNVASKLDSQ